MAASAVAGALSRPAGGPSAATRITDPRTERAILSFSLVPATGWSRNVAQPSAGIRAEGGRC